MTKKYGMRMSVVEKFFQDLKNNNCKALLTIGLDTSFDMGWQKCSSGRQYNSKSGHAFLIGMQTVKVIASVVYSKDDVKCMKHSR